LVATLLVGPSWAASAAAETFTATWDYDLRAEIPRPRPFYDCSFVGSGGLICDWIWDKGLEVSGEPMYADPTPYFDAHGFRLPLESDVDAADGLLQIVPKCLSSFHPSFDTFTPLSVVADGFFTRSPGGVFFTSSRGGLVTTLDGLGAFAGPEWTDISWMNVGLFIPDGCDDPESGLRCDAGEQALSIYSLTFDAQPIPEPASVVLLGTGLLALARRYRRRA
jgi:hypothetical protein